MTGFVLNLHYHSAFLDGVYSRDSEDAELRFHCLRLTDEEVARVVTTVRTRVMRLLVKRGLLADGDEHEPDVTDPLQDDEPLLAACYQASVEGRVATGERAGAGVRRLGRSDRDQARKVVQKGKLCVRIDGFDLHAGVRIKQTRRGCGDSGEGPR